MQHEDCFRNAKCINRTESIAVKVLHNFDDACATKALKGFCIAMLSSALRHKQRITYGALHRIGKIQQVLSA